MSLIFYGAFLSEASIKSSKVRNDIILHTSCQTDIYQTDHCYYKK